MAAQRKLQTEINQTLKKVDEGLKDFENQWSKMQSSTDPNQRERYEGELKKELKKLQRFVYKKNLILLDFVTLLDNGCN